MRLWRVVSRNLRPGGVVSASHRLIWREDDIQQCSMHKTFAITKSGRTAILPLLTRKVTHTLPFPIHFPCPPHSLAVMEDLSSCGDCPSNGGQDCTLLPGIAVRPLPRRLFLSILIPAFLGSLAASLVIVEYASRMDAWKRKATSLSVPLVSYVVPSRTSPRRRLHPRLASPLSHHPRPTTDTPSRPVRPLCTSPTARKPESIQTRS
jgi:hypothetical protein